MGVHLLNLDKVKYTPPKVPNLLKHSKLYNEQEGVKTHLPLNCLGET